MAVMNPNARRLSMVQVNGIPATALQRLEDITTATIPVATLKQEPIELSQSNPSLVFGQSYDGLDYLDFASLVLASGDPVTLVRHRGCPEAGTEICVATQPEQASQLIDRTCEYLNISTADLVWIHPSVQH
jgi:hypothetical protein